MLARPRRADRRSFERPELRREQQPVVPGQWAPRGGVQVGAGVHERRDQVAVRGVEHHQGVMQEVAVLGVPEADEPAVARDAARSLGIQPSYTHRAPAGSEGPGSSSRLRHDRQVVLLGDDPHRHRIGGERDPRRPTAGRVGHQRLRESALERHRHPSPALVAGVVAPPHHSSVGRDEYGLDTHRLVRYPPLFTARQVGHPRLPRAALVRDEGEMVCGAGTPGGEPRLRCAEPSLPEGVSVMGDDVTRPIRLVSRETLHLESLALGVAEC